MTYIFHSCHSYAYSPYGYHLWGSILLEFDHYCHHNRPPKISIFDFQQSTWSVVHRNLFTQVHIIWFFAADHIQHRQVLGHHFLSSATLPSNFDLDLFLESPSLDFSRRLIDFDQLVDSFPIIRVILRRGQLRISSLIMLGAIIPVSLYILSCLLRIHGQA